MMIETQGLTKHFGDFCALNNAEIKVPKGSIYGLVGPNGSGKTTIIRHIAGVLRPDSGQVIIDGKPVYENPEAKEIIAHVPDDLYSFPAASIQDMMIFYRSAFPRFDMSRYEKLKEAFPLNVTQPIRRFSKGMQKQAAIWLALCCRPEVILLDEPVDGLDPVMRRTVWSLILQDVAESEATVFVSSHNLRELEDVCDHVGIMHKGQLILERNLMELQSGIVKLQIAFEGDAPEAINRFDLLHTTRSGRVYEYIVRGGKDEVLAQAKALAPILTDVLPLTLEEIFIYELGGMDYAEIIL